MVEITDFPGLSKFDGSERGHVVAGGNSRSFDVSQLRLFLADPNGDWRDGVRFRTIGNVDLAGGGLADATVHDGVTAVTGDRVLVMDQTAASENGIYPVPASGAATRATDFDVQAEVLNGSIFYVFEGTLHARKAYIVTSSDPHVVDTDDITFAEHAPALGGAVEVQEAGATVVSAATILNAISGITVTDQGGGKAGLTAAGGGGGGGGLIEVAAQDFGSSSATTLDVDVTSYDQIQITFEDIDHAGGASEFAMRVSTDGSTFDAGAADYSDRFVNHTTNLRDTRNHFGLATTGQKQSGHHFVSNLNSSVFRTVLSGIFGDDASNGGFNTLGERLAAQVETHVRFFISDGSTINGGKLRVLGVKTGAKKYCIAGATAQVGIDPSPPVIAVWDLDVDDPDGWHDPVTNNTRVTPSGIAAGYVSAGFNIRLANHSTGDYFFAYLYRNGVYARTMMSAEVGVSSPAFSGFLPRVPFSPGDYFELEIQSQSDNSVDYFDATNEFVITEV